MPTAKEKLMRFLEIGARNNKKDSERIQTIHDHSVDMGATCAVAESGGFSTSDVYTLLSRAVQAKVGKESYPYIADVFDNALVYSAGYGGDLYQCDYDVDESGVVTLGDPISVVRKVQYISQANNMLGEATEIELDGECVQLVERGSNAPLTEAKTRMLKLIAPGWGSSGYYPADVLKRDGPVVFKRGLFNFWDHPTQVEEKERPEGSLSKVASVLTEDAKWLDDYAGNGPGLYAPTEVKSAYEPAIDDLSKYIGMSIRANGKGRAGEADGRKGFIIEAITNAKSVDYVTIPGAGGKVLDLFESYRPETQQIGVTNMANEEISKLQETINALNQRFIKSDADQYIRRKLSTLRVNEAVKDRIVAAVIGSVPLTESGSIDNTAFDALIEAAAKSEIDYLTSVAGLGKVRGFGESTTTGVAPVDTDKLYAEFEESLKDLD